MNTNKFKQTEIGGIPKTWQESRVGDHIELAYGDGLPERARKDGSVPVFGSNGVTGFHDKALVKGPGIIIGRKGTIGQVVFSKTDFWPIDTTYYVKIKGNDDIVFWYYFLSTLGLNQMNSHSAVPGLNRDNVYEITALVPFLPEQRAIAKILSDLDEKIKLNHQMNKTLESIGQAIFKRWFVDFEFPDKNGKPYKSSGGKMVESELGEIPEGWEVKFLDQIADFLNGLALQKYPAKGERYLPVIKIRELNQGITESTDKASPEIDTEYIVDDGDILFSWSGSLQVCIWCHGKGALNQHLFRVSSLEYPKWFYFYWVKFHLPEFQHIAQGKATTMGHIQRHHLSASLVVVPPKERLHNMTATMTPLFDTIISNSIEIIKLSQIRDSLLPRLISGKIRVNS